MNTYTKTITSLVLILLLPTAAIGNTENKEIIITIDHSSGGTTYSGVLEANKGDSILLRVTNTEKSCYSYNLKQFDGAGTDGGDPLPVRVVRAPHKDTVEFNDIHNGLTNAYEIEIKIRAGEVVARCNNQDFKRRFEFQVINWKLAFSGSVALNNLVSPKFFLEPGSINDATGMPNDGFFVRSNDGAQNEKSTGFAVLAHLYHQNKLNLSKRYNLQWAPISFGFGAGEESNTQLYLGTSFKFGERFFLTIGKVWGDVDRLPSNVPINGFTTNANAITTLGSQTKDATFIGLSYQFGGINLSKFSAPFAVKKPSAE